MPLKIFSVHKKSWWKTFVKISNEYTLQKEFKKLKTPQENEAKIQLTDGSVFLKYRTTTQDNPLHRTLINFIQIKRHRSKNTNSRSLKNFWHAIKSSERSFGHLLWGKLPLIY